MPEQHKIQKLPSRLDETIVSTMWINRKHRFAKWKFASRLHETRIFTFSFLSDFPKIAFRLRETAPGQTPRHPTFQQQKSFLSVSPTPNDKFRFWTPGFVLFHFFSILQKTVYVYMVFLSWLTKEEVRSPGTIGPDPVTFSVGSDCNPMIRLLQKQTWCRSITRKCIENTLRFLIYGIFNYMGNFIHGIFNTWFSYILIGFH